jgi:hypothetical protein
MTFEKLIAAVAERSPFLAKQFEKIARKNAKIPETLGFYAETQTRYLDAETSDFWRVSARRAFFFALADANASRFFEPVSHVVETVARQEVEFAQRARIASFADAELVLK